MKEADKIDLRATNAGCVLPVKVVPGASRDRFAGVLGTSLKVATSAPPEKGKANAAVAKIIAAALNVSPKSVTIHSGPSNPRKEFLVQGLTPQTVRQRLAESK